MFNDFNSITESTPAAIIEAANRLFSANGYHGTSMRQIAQEAGIAVAGIYNHFSSKEEIFITVLEVHHPYNDVIPALRAAQGESLAEFVRDAAQKMITSLDRQPGFLNLMFIELVEFDAQHVPLLFEKFFPEVRLVLERFAQGQSELRSIPIPVLIRAFFGLFFSYFITGQLLGPRLPVEMQENAFDYFVDIYLHGILGNPPKKFVNKEAC